MTAGTLEHALDYAARGWHVLPLRGKRPAIPQEQGGHGWQTATRDPARIREQWTRYPGAGVGIACRPSGLLVPDVDPDKGDDDRLHDLERQFGPLPRTVECLSGGG